MNKIECVIMDWAGTAVDYGCFAPVAAFVECFKNMGLTVTAEETRAHMGLTKIEEIRALFAIDHVREEFAEKYGRDYNEDDVQACYKGFQDKLMATLADYSEPIDGGGCAKGTGHKAGIDHGLHQDHDGHCDKGCGRERLYR